MFETLYPLRMSGKGKESDPTDALGVGSGKDVFWNCTIQADSHLYFKFFKLSCLLTYRMQLDITEDWTGV